LREASTAPQTEATRKLQANLVLASGGLNVSSLQSYELQAKLTRKVSGEASISFKRS